MSVEDKLSENQVILPPRPPRVLFFPPLALLLLLLLLFLLLLLLLFLVLAALLKLFGVCVLFPLPAACFPLPRPPPRRTKTLIKTHTDQKLAACSYAVKIADPRLLLNYNVGRGCNIGGDVHGTSHVWGNGVIHNL